MNKTMKNKWIKIGIGVVLIAVISFVVYGAIERIWFPEQVAIKSDLKKLNSKENLAQLDGEFEYDEKDSAYTFIFNENVKKELEKLQKEEDDMTMSDNEVSRQVNSQLYTIAMDIAPTYNIQSILDNKSKPKEITIQADSPLDENSTAMIVVNGELVYLAPSFSVGGIKGLYYNFDEE